MPCLFAIWGAVWLSPQKRQCRDCLVGLVTSPTSSYRPSPCALLDLGSGWCSRKGSPQLGSTRSRELRVSRRVAPSHPCPYTWWVTPRHLIVLVWRGSNISRHNSESRVEHEGAGLHGHQQGDGAAHGHRDCSQSSMWVLPCSGWKLNARLFFFCIKHRSAYICFRLQIDPPVVTINLVIPFVFTGLNSRIQAVAFCFHRSKQ